MNSYQMEAKIPKLIILLKSDNIIYVLSPCPTLVLGWPFQVKYNIYNNVIMFKHVSIFSNYTILGVMSGITLFCS